MYTDFVCTVKTSIVVLITAYCVSSDDIDSLPVIDRTHIARCRAPDLSPICDIQLIPMVNYQRFAWFYDPTFKTCRCLWGNFYLYLCWWQNSVLSITKQECEDYCGEPCFVYGVNKTEPGVCMDETYCMFHDYELNKTATAIDPTPCNHLHSDVKCCPRNHIQYF